MANYYATCRSNYFNVKDDDAFDEETGEETEIDLPEIVAKHLVDGDVAVFMESGAEKLRYVGGYAEAINNKGERKSISLQQIFELAKKLGTNVSEASL